MWTWAEDLCILQWMVLDDFYCMSRNIWWWSEYRRDTINVVLLRKEFRKSTIISMERYLDLSTSFYLFLYVLYKPRMSYMFWVPWDFALDLYNIVFFSYPPITRLWYKFTLNSNGILTEMVEYIKASTYIYIYIYIYEGGQIDKFSRVCIFCTL